MQMADKHEAAPTAVKPPKEFRETVKIGSASSWDKNIVSLFHVLEVREAFAKDYTLWCLFNVGFLKYLFLCTFRISTAMHGTICVSIRYETHCLPQLSNYRIIGNFSSALPKTDVFRDPGLGLVESERLSSWSSQSWKWGSIRFVCCRRKWLGKA